ncbi:MAG: LTA synthase family protein [Clostridia bacterium]|nr:LTA synthase family protein [Clostridia bacterium]
MFRRNIAPYFPVLFFPLTLFFLECVVKVSLFGGFFNKGLGYTLLFSIPAGLLCSVLCVLWGRQGNRVLSIVLMSLITLWYMAQTVYYTIFKTFLTLYSVGGTGKVLKFWREILTGIGAAFLPLLLLAIPLVLLCLLGGRFTPYSRAGGRLIGGLALCTAGLQLVAVLAVINSAAGVLSPKVLYEESFIPELSVSTFGVATTLRLDARQLLFGAPSEAPEPTGEPTPAQTAEVTPSPIPEVVYAPNVMDIDYETLIAGESDKTLLALHQYFSARTPTMQNEYTGMFEGKNLIFLTAEGFSSYAVDPELTPTLYKLASTGFVFTDFYNPLWWVSTSDGEYVACTSLIPKSGVWSFYQSRNNDMYFCMGNQFERLGYSTRAYHNHTWDYYRRDVSHPNMGYDYKGLGHGLVVKKTWPESDVEMMEVTLPEYLNDRPFHTYYMTVSGHMNYTFMGNSMASKHKDEVAHLELSENARAYIACQMELDRALEYLLEQLEAAGQLENTVICLSADHYPYGLDKSIIDELAGHEVDESFEIYKSTLILWSGDMTEPVVVDKPCESLDIIPTLSNLFGLDYDSRLLLGQDILSDSPGLVVFSNRSFISEWGRYDSQADVFTPNQGADVPEDYALGIIREVKDMFSYSVKLLENDYYAKLGLPH